MEEDQQISKVLTEQPNLLIELTLVSGIKQYFAALRHSRGHNPEGSPIDLEILLLIKLISSSVENPVQTLHEMGIIIVGEEIAINAKFLTLVLSTCRSRINNSIKNLGWCMSPHNNQQKYELLHPLVDRKDARNWTIRTIPPGSPVYQFIHDNPQVQLRPTTTSNDNQNDPSLTLPLPLMLDNTGDQKEETLVTHTADAFQ